MAFLHASTISSSEKPISSDQASMYASSVLVGIDLEMPSS